MIMFRIPVLSRAGPTWSLLVKVPFLPSVHLVNTFWTLRAQPLLLLFKRYLYLPHWGLRPLFKRHLPHFRPVTAWQLLQASGKLWKEASLPSFQCLSWALLRNSHPEMLTVSTYDEPSILSVWLNNANIVLFPTSSARRLGYVFFDTKIVLVDDSAHGVALELAIDSYNS